MPRTRASQLEREFVAFLDQEAGKILPYLERGEAPPTKIMQTSWLAAQLRRQHLERLMEGEPT
jgi:hypothetical protein